MRLQPAVTEYVCWMCLAPDRGGTAAVEATDSLFQHFPEHHRHSGFPSTRAEPLPRRPEHAPYRCPQPLPGGAGPRRTAAKRNDRVFFKTADYGHLCSALLISLSHSLAWKRREQRGGGKLTLLTPACCFTLLGLTGPCLCKHSSSDLLLVVLGQGTALGCVSPLPRVPPPACLWSLSLALLDVCVLIWKSVNSYIMTELLNPSILDIN